MSATGMKAIIKRWTVPLLACGMVLGASTARAQTPGDVIGFSVVSPTVNGQTFLAAGDTVQFRVRLAGPFVVDQYVPNPIPTRPSLKMRVGTSGAAAYAELKTWDYIDHTGPLSHLARTDLYFEYTVRPGDMATPLLIDGNAVTPFTVLGGDYLIYHVTTLVGVQWRVDTAKYDQPMGANDSGEFISQWDYNMVSLGLKITTLDWVALNCPTSIEASENKTCRIGMGAALTNEAVVLKVWTPDTTYLEIIGTGIDGAANVTIPAGATYIDFPIRGVSDTPLGNPARIFAQRQSDFLQNPVPFAGESGITNAIKHLIAVTPPPNPTAKIIFPQNLMSTLEINETVTPNAGQFKIALSEASLNDVWVQVDVQNIAGENNISLAPPVGGYRVLAGQLESAAVYYFNPLDGTPSSEAIGAYLIPTVTNTAYYTESTWGTVYIKNVLPTISLTYPGVNPVVGAPFTFNWTIQDVLADLQDGITAIWYFGEGAQVTQVYSTSGSVPLLSGVETYTFLSPGPKAGWVRVYDKDSPGIYTEVSFLVTVDPPTPNESVSVRMDNYRYVEGVSADLWVILSHPCVDPVTVNLTAELAGLSQLGLTLDLSTTTVTIPMGQKTNMVPVNVTFLDGTAATASTGITITPAIAGTANAIAQFLDAYEWPVYVTNAPPVITSPMSSALPVAPYDAVPQGLPFTYNVTVSDVQADLDAGLTVRWRFGGGTWTNGTGSAGFYSLTYSVDAPGQQLVEVQAIDKDGAISSTVSFPILVVPPTPAPSVRVDTSSYTIVESAGAQSFWVRLSQPFHQPIEVTLTVTPPTVPPTGRIEVPSSITIGAGLTEFQVWYTVFDGTPSSLNTGFVVTPSIAPGQLGDPDLTFTGIPLAGYIRVQNEPPVILSPIAWSTNTIATVDIPYLFSYTVTDVQDDLTAGITLIWNWGDGTPVSTMTTYTGIGTISHTFTEAAEQRTVTLQATDKDNGITQITFYVIVKDSQKVLVVPIGPNNADYHGMPGTGTGTVTSPSTTMVTTTGSFAGQDLVYTFYFGTALPTARFDANPDLLGADRPTDNKKSYFFVWDGPTDVFVDPADATVPLSAGVNSGLTVIKLAGSGSGQTEAIKIKAIFSLECFATGTSWIGDGCGDINQDGVPDWAVGRYFLDLDGNGGGGDTLDPIWFRDLRGYNDDGDYYPANPGGVGGVYDFRPIPPGAAFNARLEIRGEDDHLGDQFNALGGVYNDDPGTDPTLEDTDGDGFPDGWEYWFWVQAYNRGMEGGRSGWRYNPLNPAQGIYIAPREIVEAFNPTIPRTSANIDKEWMEDFDNDGLLDLEELVLGTDPTNWDTDGDGMADGWEVLMGLNPCDANDGLDWTRNNPDGDYFAIAAVPRVMLTMVVTNEVVGIDEVSLTTVTNRYLARVEGGAAVPGTFTTCYRYGNDRAPWAVGRPLTEDPNWLAADVSEYSFEQMDVLIMHFQVRDEFGFDPRTAWCRAVPRFGRARTYAADDPRAWDAQTRLQALAVAHNINRWGPWVISDAPYTRAFTSVDEYLLMRFMYELGLEGTGVDVLEDIYDDQGNVIGERIRGMRSRGGNDWFRYSTHPRTPDTSATPQNTARVPDGWKLYVATAPGTTAFVHSPWDNLDGSLVDADGDRLVLQREFWGTDSLSFYSNPQQYLATIPYFGGEIAPEQVAAAVIEFRTGVTNNISVLNRGRYTASMVGVVTIARPDGHQDNNWINKFWPTDPWHGDTDRDGLRDDQEGQYFIYGQPVDDGSTCIAGGGLNPCSWDTDGDSLPDAWEVCFAGSGAVVPALTPVQHGLTSVLWPQPDSQNLSIVNGQDGTVQDAGFDWDHDGLVNYEEYMTQAIRGFRYDVPDVGVAADDPTNILFSGQRGLPMDMSFDIADLFTQVTYVWDRSGWFMLPPEQTLYADVIYPNPPVTPFRYASTDPSLADTTNDGMDDYYKLYHGLNPLLGNPSVGGLAADRVAWAYRTTPILWNANWWTTTYGLSYNFVQFPWLNGMPNVDPDADGLLNMEERLLANASAPDNPNSDPSPLWMTDPSNPESVTARFYRTRGTGAYPAMGTWWPMGMFMYSFEMNEGYDTDNDGISDKDELIGNRNAMSDPRDSESPYHRQAIWFSGTNSAVATPVLYSNTGPFGGANMYDPEIIHSFRSFTVELWVRPERVDRDQVLIERVFNYGVSDLGALPGAGQRRNFLIGIAADGRAYAGYDGAGSHEEHTDAVRLFGQQILVNKWTHLAARMDGREQKFTLFVNGVAQDTMDTALPPANGFFLLPDYTFENEGVPDTFSSISGALVLGAENNVSTGISIGQNYYPGVTAEIEMVWDSTWSQYNKFYQGWMAEVRVWDGARSNVEINNDFNRRLSYDDLMANRTLVQNEILNGASRVATAPVPLSPLLRNYYTFNSLFSALSPDHVAVVPRGFNAPAATIARPADANVRWWQNTEMTSTVYSDKQYLPWIQNVVAHLPLYTYTTDTNGFLLAFGTNNIVADSYYWRGDAMGTEPVQNMFPNRNNPYGFAFSGSAYAWSVHLSADMLPIGGTWAKQCIDLWDGQGPTGTWLESMDITDDGLPQWWLDLNYGSGAPGTGWNDLYTGLNPFYQDLEMTNGEVYQRDQAKGQQPDAITYDDYNPNYAQTADSDGDGLPDWWEKMYGLDPMDPTGDNGAGGDPDMDGLSNYAEYLISEVYGFRLSSPRKFKTIASQVFSDYYVMLSKVPLGFMFSDHDFIEDWWEDQYAPTHANRFVYDPHVDYDSDGWSNWAEARYSLAVRSVRPDRQMSMMANGVVNYELPIPIVKTYLTYKGIQSIGNVAIHAYSDPEMNGQPDATWSLAFGGGITPMELPIGFFDARVISTHLSPGSVVPGTIGFRFTDMWTGLSAQSGFDMNGKIYSMPMGGYSYDIGEIDYITGEISVDMSDYQNSVIILDQAGYLNGDPNSFIRCDDAYVEILYSVSLPNNWPQTLYLGRADMGYLREGTNYFVAFMDLDNNNSWDPGEPMGISTPFGTDIGWDVNSVKFELTDYTPGYLRMSFDGTRTEDVIFGDGGTTGGGGQQGGPQSAHIRVQRWRLGQSGAYQGTVFDKVVTGRNYIHEGDFLTSPSAGGFALDWGWDNYNQGPEVSTVYRVFLGEGSMDTNGIPPIATFTNNYFTAIPAKAVPTLPMHGSYVYSARPTFRWSMPDDYTAFAIEFRKSTSTGTLLYPIVARQVPPRDPITGDYVWEAPFYIGDKDVVNNGIYYWRVAGLNSKYTAPTTQSWSQPQMFRWDVNQPMQSSGYGQINATVKYFGPAVNLADKVILQAFDNRGFTGDPAAQFVFEAGTAQLALVTDLSNTTTNAYLRGLAPGTYYLRAFIDSNNNGVRDIWESWGYANYYGEQRAMYNARPVKVDFSTLIPAVQIFIEDCDVDQDWFPDAWEYEQHSGAYPTFLQQIGPQASWLFGHAEINPDLDYSVGWGGIPWLLGPITSGQTLSDIIAMLSDTTTYPLAGDGFTLQQKVEMGLMPSDKLALRITQSPLIDPATAKVAWEMSITKDSSANTDIRDLMGTSTTYVYELMYSPTLDNPTTWKVVDGAGGQFDLDDGVTPSIPISVDNPALKGIDLQRGFFKISVKRK
ncbi:MAG: hypothetical protein FWH21_00945 [Kiritimatiellaeota bacterium]|nr:hypothetical protein [Kiritimatiellota bacterium]